MSETADGYATSEREAHLRQALPGALIGNEYFICLQPCFQLPERQILGAEALLRWNMPDRGILFPQEFIATASALGLLMPLDLLALGEACKLLIEGMAYAEPFAPLGVNATLDSLRQPEYFAIAEDMIRRGNLPDGSILFEISAEDVLRAPDDIAYAAEQIRLMRCGFVIQGVYNQPDILAHCERLMPDIVKINCTQIAPNGEEEYLSICVRIYQEAEQMGLIAMCECVEHKPVLEYLAAHGCTAMQGYALSMPLPKRVYTHTLRRYVAQTM